VRRVVSIRESLWAKSLRQFVSGKIVKFVMTNQETPCRRADLGNPYCGERQSSVDDKERRASLMRHEHKCESREHQQNQKGQHVDANEGHPADQTVGFEVEDADCLQQAAATLERLGHRVQGGCADDAARRKVRAFIGFEDPSGNHIELVARA